MLKNLLVENIAVISRAEIDFTGGLSVLTGETGAGKSVLLGGIGAVMGGRVGRDLIRAGCDKAFVSALFEDVSRFGSEKARALGFECEDSILITREIYKDGRTVCRINGRTANVSVVREIAACLLNIHGQHDNQQIMNADNHYLFLDMFMEDTDKKEEYKKTFSNFRELKREYDILNANESEKERSRDFLSFKINEITAADITPGELDGLLARQSALLHAEKIRNALSGVLSALEGEEDGGAVHLVREAAREVMTASELHPDLPELCDRLHSTAIELADISSVAQGYIEDLEGSPGELDDITERVELIKRMQRKYGGDEQSILDALEQAKRDISLIETGEERLMQLEDELEQAKILLIEAGAGLTSERKKSAGLICGKIQEVLTYLDMPGVKFTCEVNPSPYGRKGCDEISFLISTNRGEEPKPISKIASGGELSRIMLAIKSVLAEKDDIDTLIFDEIDAGISGFAALKVGAKLKDTAKWRQVICVTHLAQIAAAAGSHYRIQKTQDETSTYTTVDKLSEEERLLELARIIGGSGAQANLDAAEELLRVTRD